MVMTGHNILVAEALDAIDAVRDDATMSPEEVLRSLELLEERVGILICAIEGRIEDEQA